MIVLIKGMKMPKHCWQCRFKDCEDLCVLLDDDCMKIWGEQNRLPNCPLIELPDHGDLVDVDALKAECKEPYVWWETETQMARILEDAPVVIPAERSKE